MAFLEAQKLVKEYKRRGKSFRAVDDIDFSIEPGEFVMIEGESGSGKTTFLNLITGLTDPTSGIVTIGGRSLKDTGDKEISKIRNEKIKYIPQGESLLSALTVRENILFPFTIGGAKRPSEERLLEVDFEGGLKVPFLISITRLSSMWKWNKRTVMAFIETLQRHGAIEVKKNWNGTLVRMLNISKIPPQTADKTL